MSNPRSLVLAVSPEAKIVAAITLSTHDSGSPIVRSNFRPGIDFRSADLEAAGDEETLIAIIPATDSDINNGVEFLGAMCRMSEEVDLTLSCLVAAAFKQGVRWRDDNPKAPIKL